jgi:hypothetical protein
LFCTMVGMLVIDPDKNPIVSSGPVNARRFVSSSSMEV